VAELFLPIAVQQHGLVTLAQYLEAGGSRSSWDRLHHRGVLVRVHRTVARVDSLPAGLEQRALAPVLAAGAGALVSHLTAARLWGADVDGFDPIDVTVTERGRRLRMAGVRLHRPTDRADLSPVVRAGVPVTNPIRTALDVGAVASVPTVGGVVETFLVQRYLTVRTLEVALARHAVRGRPGVRILREVLDDLLLGAKPPDSVLEPAFARLLVSRSLPAPVFHHVIVTGSRSYELDFAYVDERIDVEVDGWAHHGAREAFEADRRRDAELAALGWVVVRFTWRQVVHDGARVAAQIAAVLRVRSRRQDHRC
jgi:very-short-patch-repair endonuclease